jgi:chromosome segregation ATPase
MADLNLENKDRRSSVWAVCDHLATAEKVKPSVREVRRHYTRGSDSDVQTDINAWWEALFGFYRDRHTRPNLPVGVVEGVEALWNLALGEAAKTVKEIQAVAEQQIAGAMEEMAASRAAAEAAREETRDLAAKLDLANQRIEHLQSDVAGLEGRLAQESALRAGAEAQIATLREEIARKDAEFRAAGEAHGAALKAEQEAHAIQLKAEQDRYDGMNRFLLQQADDMRQQKLAAAAQAAAENENLRTMGEAYRKRALAAEHTAAVEQGKSEQQAAELAALRLESGSTLARMSDEVTSARAAFATLTEQLKAHQRVLHLAVGQIRTLKETPLTRQAEAVNTAVSSIELAIESSGVGPI